MSIGLVSGWGAPSVEELFFDGTPTDSSSPPAPSPFKRGSRLSAQEVEMLASRRTELELAKLYRAVARADKSGVVQSLPGYKCRGSGHGFVRTDGAASSSVSYLSPAAQHNLSRHMMNSGDLDCVRRVSFDDVEDDDL